MPVSTPTKLFDSGGQPIGLSADPLGIGGEGAVYAIPARPALVAKVYSSTPSSEHSRKLITMAALATDELTKFAAWPTATLHRTPGGPVAGILMPKVTGCKEIHHLYSVAQRKKDFPDASWRFLAYAARNCAIAFHAVHQHGHVVGDVNQKNVLVSTKAIVQLVDCDSFQVRGPDGRVYRCGVGVPEYTPPELQGVSFRDVDRGADHDLFGLAVLIFHLLMMGRHPFSGVYSGPGEMPLEKAIRNGLFAYGRAAQARKMAPPPNTLPIGVLDSELVALFERAFVPASGHTSPKRPLADEWRAALDSLLKKLKECPTDPNHVFPASAGSCPWCKLLGSAGVIFFLPGSQGGQAGPIDVAAVWIQISGIEFPERPYVRPRHSLGGEPRPTPLPRNIPAPSPYPRLLEVPRDPVEPDFFLDRVGAIGLVVGLALLPFAPPVGVVCVAGFGALFVALFSQRSRRWKEAREQADAEIARAEAYNTELESVWRAENADWYREHLRRNKRLEALEAELSTLEEKYHALSTERKRQFSEASELLRRAKREHEEAQQEYAGELSDLAKHSQRIQLEAYLDSLLIRDAKLKSMTTDRVLSLSSFGIETALDVEKLSRTKVPGIGTVLTTRLIEWRDASARSFRPQQGIPAPLRAAVVQRHQARLRKCEVILANGPGQLREIVGSLESGRRNLLGRIQLVVNQRELAASDMLAVQMPS